MIQPPIPEVQTRMDKAKDSIYADREFEKTLRNLVLLRDKRFIGDMSDPVQMSMYRNNITNAAIDAAEERMRKEGLLSGRHRS